MDKAKEQIMAKIAQAGVRTIRIETATGAKKYVCVGNSYDDIAKKAKAAMRRDAVVTWDDGREQWIEDKPIMENVCEFVWDESGNKVKCERTLVTKVGGDITNEVLRVIFVDYSKI